MKSVQFTVFCEQELQQLAAQISDYLQQDMTVLLDGELGAGKTSFTKGIANGLGITQIVKSPTYTFVKEYTTGRIPLYHLDVYRLENMSYEGLGLEEFFDCHGICVVEWSQFIQDILPRDYLLVHIERVNDNDNARYIKISAYGKPYENLIKKFEQTV